MLPDKTSNKESKRRLSVFPLLAALAHKARRIRKRFKFPEPTEIAKETLQDYLQTLRESEAREKPSQRSLLRATGQKRYNRGRRRGEQKELREIWSRLVPLGYVEGSAFETPNKYDEFKKRISPRVMREIFLDIYRSHIIKKDTSTKRLLQKRSSS